MNKTLFRSIFWMLVSFALVATMGYIVLGPLQDISRSSEEPTSDQVEPENQLEPTKEPFQDMGSPSEYWSVLNYYNQNKLVFTHVDGQEFRVFLKFGWDTIAFSTNGNAFVVFNQRSGVLTYANINLADYSYVLFGISEFDFWGDTIIYRQIRYDSNAVGYLSADAIEGPSFIDMGLTIESYEIVSSTENQITILANGQEYIWTK